MSIRFRKDRNKYELSVPMDGKRKRLLFQTKREASDFLARPNLDPDSITIDGAIKTYYRNVSVGHSRSSAVSEKRYFNLMFHFLVQEKGHTNLSQIRYGDMVALQRWLSEPMEYDGKPMRLGASTVNRAFHSIKAFFIYWVRDGQLIASPCAHLEMLQEKEKPRRPMTVAEFLGALKKAPDWYKPAMAFMHLTAAAPSSIARLRSADIDFEAKRLTITRRKGAKGKWREIPFPLNDELKALLMAQPRSRHGFVFSNESGGPLTAEWCSRIGNRAIRAASLKGVVLYSIRHALASELTDANVSTEIVRQLMGHANIRTTQRYSKPQTESLANALTLVRGGKCHQNATKGDGDLPEVNIEIAT